MTRRLDVPFDTVFVGNATNWILDIDDGNTPPVAVDVSATQAALEFIVRDQTTGTMIYQVGPTAGANIVISSTVAGTARAKLTGTNNRVTVKSTRTQNALLLPGKVYIGALWDNTVGSEKCLWLGVIPVGSAPQP